MSLPGPASSRPAHLRWRLIGLVALGGAAGTGVRQGLSLLIPAVAGAFPTAIFLVNLSGAFLLGLLLGWLLRSGPDEGRRRELRLLAGTGFLGGYTTYSSLSVATAQLLTGGHGLVGIAYALGTVVLGSLAAYAGVALGTYVDTALGAGMYRAGVRRGRGEQ